MEVGIIVKLLRLLPNVQHAKETQLKRVGFKSLQEIGEILNIIHHHDIPLQYDFLIKN
jgi:hypothetical protein